MKKTEIQMLYQEMFHEYPDVLNIEHIQKILGISRNNAYALIQSGELTGIKIANKYRIPKPNLIVYLFEKNFKKNSENI